MNLSLGDSVKLYKITFRRYTNASRDTVACYENSCTGPEYVQCENDGGKGFIICSEYDIIFFQKYGMGIDTMEYVGPYYGDRYKNKTEIKDRFPESLAIPYSAMESNGKCITVPCSPNEPADVAHIKELR